MKLINVQDGVLSVNWQVMSGIVSDYYQLPAGYRRIYDIEYPWRQECLDNIKKLQSSKIELCATTKNLFSDIDKLNTNFRVMIESVFNKPINAGTFNVIYYQIKKIALVLLNEEIITARTYKLLIKLKDDVTIKKFTTKSRTEDNVIESQAKTRIFFFKFIDFIQKTSPDHLLYAKFQFLKFHLSTKGLRIGSIEDIKNNQIGRTGLMFKVFKKKNLEGFEWQSYPWRLIEEPYSEWFFELKNINRPEDKFFTSAPTHFNVPMRKFTNYIYKTNAKLELEGLEHYRKWQKHTHSGRHSFILKCHVHGLSNKEISDMTLQSEEIISRFYTNNIAKQIQKQRTFAKFINSEQSNTNTLHSINSQIKIS